MHLRRSAAGTLIRVLVTAALLLSLETAGSPTARAQGVSGTVSGAISSVEVDSERYRNALGARDATVERIAAAEATIESTSAWLEELRLAESQLSATIPVLEGRLTASQGKLEEAVDTLNQFSISAYTSGGPTALGLAALAGVESATDALSHRTLVEVAGRSRTRDVERRRVQEADDTMALGAATTDLQVIRTRIADNTARREQALITLEQGRDALPQLQAEVRAARRVARVVGTDLLLVNLEAYMAAAEAARAAACGIDWTILAGIGRVESRHGHFGGTSVDGSGDLSRPILGIPLNGENNTAVIPDTDGGNLDGDPEWDRAVGPMQFIPGTWAGYAADGDGDGDADPQNLYDSSRAAATYLCVSGDLTVPENLRSAIFRYNRSEAYVEAVLGHIETYRRTGIG